MKGLKYILLLPIFALAVFFLLPSKVNAAEPRTYHFSYIKDGNTKYNLTIEGNGKVIAVYQVKSREGMRPEHYHQFQNNGFFAFYTLADDGQSAVSVYPKIAQEFTLVGGEWVLKNDYLPTAERPNFSEPVYYGVDTNNRYCFLDVSTSGIEVLKVNIHYPVNGSIYTYTSKDLLTNVYSYLLNGTFIDMPEKYTFVRYRNGLQNFVPCTHFNPQGVSSNVVQAKPPSNVNISLAGFKIDSEKGTVSWNGFPCPDNVLSKGVLCMMSGNNNYTAYGTLLASAGTYEINLKDVTYAYGSNLSNLTGSYISFYPFYVLPNGQMYLGQEARLTSLKDDSIAYTRSNTSIFTLVKDNSFGADNNGGVLPDDGDSGIYKPIDESQSDIIESAKYEDSIKLTDFSADYTVIANWSGLEYSDKFQKYWLDKPTGGKITDKKVIVQLLYCNKSAPTQVQYRKTLSGMYDIDDLKCVVDVSKYAPDNPDYYLFGVVFTPYVRVTVPPNALSNIEISQWYFGSKNTVYFTPEDDGFKIEIDTGDKNNSHDDNNVWNNGGSGSIFDSIFGGFSDVAGFFKNLGNFGGHLKNLVSALGQVPLLIAHVFSFLPSWVLEIIAAVLAVVAILRILGR